MNRELHLCAFFPEDIDRVVQMYTEGVSIEAISQAIGLSVREVNFILDHYAPHL